MRLTALILFLLCVGNFAALYFIGVPLDKKFITDILIGLLSNLMVLIVGVLIIDRLLKNIERGKLTVINKRNSENTLMMINLFCTKLFNHLKLGEEQNLSNMDKTLEKLLEINKKSNWFGILHKLFLDSADKRTYLKELEKIIQDGASSINKSLKDVYPHPAPELLVLADEIGARSGHVMVMGVLPGIREKVNALLPAEHEKMTEELEQILTEFFIHQGTEDLFPYIFTRLDVITQRARANTLFID